MLLSIISCGGSYLIKYSLKDPIPNNNLVFSDTNVDLSFSIDEKLINFTLKNKSDKSIRIIWDEVQFVDLLNETSPICHKGISLKLAINLISQPPSVVFKGTTYNDYLIPIKNLFLYKDFLTKQDEVGIKNLIKINTDEDIEFFKGRVLGLYFPIEFEGEKKVYIFSFKIEDIFEETSKKKSSKKK
jgi:hypothetical protein